MNLLLLLAAAAAAAPRFDAGTISGLPARNIGSAAMSGRVSAVTAVRVDGRLTVFAGSASGGVWKSVNGGTTFTPVFDDAAVQSIGAVAVDPSNPKNVWVGTGESWLRNSVSIGDGVYKSVDGGDNFVNVGLKDSEHIAKILVDPKDGATVYACALGHSFTDGGERGVFKTTDGGKTWKLVLAGSDPATGCAMLAMDPSSPMTLYASLWDYRRKAWTYRSGGTGSGLFKTEDGGAHWTQLTPQAGNGLPEKPYGRIAVAVAPSNHKVVYAMIESAKSALYRSDDGGKTWDRRDASQYMVWRPFYFANLIVDPKDENKVFKVDLNLLRSVDGGKSFSPVTSGAHGDFHDVWIDPSETSLVFAADDGGLWRSHDGGSRWEHMMNLPVSQFYHVSVDGADPYRVYGGLQDNGNWVGDSSYPGGVSNQRWESMYDGDGFWVWEDPADANYIYAESQGGEVARVNRRTHESRAIKPYPRYGEKKLRFNWNTPIALSPNEKGTIYLGSQFLYRSRDHGQSWERISPDLTTNDPEKQKQEESGGITTDNSSAEMNTTIYSISESPLDAKAIWAGTDDGNVQLTRDAGKSWTKVSGSVPGLGPDAWVTTVRASRWAAPTAYATFDRHMSGDMTPYVYKTTDWGKTWISIDLAGVRGWAHVITEDSKDPKLLYLGTELGLWVSIDGGEHWAQYKGSRFPAVAVRDIVVQPRTSDLVLATHGRGIWIVDDISPWRSLTPDLMAKDAAFLPMPKAVEVMETDGGWSEGDATYVGPNRPAEAFIPYYQRTRHIFGDLKIEVFDGAGMLVDTVPSTKRRGVNRAVWAMHLKPPHVPPAASAVGGASIGPRIVPGVYTVKMTKDGKVYETKLNVALDPRAAYTVADKAAQFALAVRLSKLLDHMSWAVDAIVSVRDAANAAAARSSDDGTLKASLEDLAQDADKIRGKIVATKEGGAITGEERLREFLGGLYGDVNGYEGKPTAEQEKRALVLKRELDDVIGEFTALAGKRLPELNRRLAARKLEPLAVLSETAWSAAQDERPAGAREPSQHRADDD